MLMLHIFGLVTMKSSGTSFSLEALLWYNFLAKCLRIPRFTAGGFIEICTLNLNSLQKQKYFWTEKKTVIYHPIQTLY